MSNSDSVTGPAGLRRQSTGAAGQVPESVGKKGLGRVRMQKKTSSLSSSRTQLHSTKIALNSRLDLVPAQRKETQTRGKSGPNTLPSPSPLPTAHTPLLFRCTGSFAVVTPTPHFGPYLSLLEHLLRVS